MKLRTSCHIPDSVELIIPFEGAMDKEIFLGRVALIACALMHGLSLPICFPVENVLDLL